MNYIIRSSNIVFFTHRHISGDMNKPESGHRLTLFFSIFFFILILPPSFAPPTTAAKHKFLYTNSRWIVDKQGQRTKLGCVNWVSHLEPVVAEGLSKQPLDAISKQIVGRGFNCVRFTWPLFLATNDTLASLTVRQSLTSLGLKGTIAGFQDHNPNLLNFTLMNAFKEVVANLGNNNVMVILDNHISQPMWCCDNFDNNGFFGDIFFNPDVWVAGLTRMATLFKGTSNVVGMSLRNELRGPKQNVMDWYRQMTRGAEAVHAANQDVLVILSGMNFAMDLSFLMQQQIKLSFTSKLVFEVHWYDFTNAKAWEKSNLNNACAQVRRSFMKSVGFLLEKDDGYPLFVSEYGLDQRGTNVNNNKYFNCFLSVAAELDLDLALWTLVGIYYYREGVPNMEEYYGIVNADWSKIRNASLLKRISSIQPPFQGPGLSGKLHKLCFHPLTGLCIQNDSKSGMLKLSDCLDSENWKYTSQQTLSIMGTNLCVQAVGLGKPVNLSTNCRAASSKWDTISNSKMHLATKVSGGTQLCLDVDTKGNIISNACKCLSTNNTCDPASQWFKLVDSTRRSSQKK